ncbi:caffeoylshikimate esterase-like [Diospyros lotus]|uniref:caffeoylshikimate esterase-like n=1 Tax=Diospyros lotus TaxID=55363 RepID=UPI002256FCFA|nr:caffeoylshikimate esterase-like [Diospyros lotus]
MAHPILEANENSPFGGLTREEFHKKHHILHQECFMLNKKSMKIFTQSWQPDPSPGQLRGLVAMIHGYMDESSWLNQLTAVGIAKAGFYVCALDLPGHGYSDGPKNHIPDIQPVVEDCIQFFDSVRGNRPNLPAFLFGQSLGGAIATLICLKQKSEWSGLVLDGAMCGVSKKFKPIWPLEELLPVAAFIAPTWQIAVTECPLKKSHKEEWKRKLIKKNPNHLANRKVTAASALEFLRVCDHITRNCHGLEVPVLLVHGGEDKICDPKSASLFHDSVRSKDKTLKIFAGMWHMFLGEPNETVEFVFGTILSWIGERADKATQPEASLVEK